MTVQVIIDKQKREIELSDTQLSSIILEDGILTARQILKAADSNIEGFTRVRSMGKYLERINITTDDNRTFWFNIKTYKTKAGTLKVKIEHGGEEFTWQGPEVPNLIRVPDLM